MMMREPNFEKGLTQALRELVEAMEAQGEKARTGVARLGTIELSTGETPFCVAIHRDGFPEILDVLHRSKSQTLPISTGDTAIREVLSPVLEVELGRFMCEALYLCDDAQLHQRFMTELSEDGRRLIGRVHARLTELLRRDAVAT
jgi:hypothetical protein